MNRKELFEKVNTPQELMDYMDKYIEYGWVDKDGEKHINDLKGLRENYRVSSLDEMFESGVGTCIEQANMIKTFFDRKGFETKMFCHRSYETEENFDAEVRMHCFVLFKYLDKWYHFEHSNSGRRGIHQYSSVEEAIENITRWHKEHGDIRKITEFDEIPAGLSFKELTAAGSALTSILPSILVTLIPFACLLPVATKLTLSFSSKMINLLSSFS